MCNVATGVALSPVWILPPSSPFSIFSALDLGREPSVCSEDFFTFYICHMSQPGSRPGSQLFLVCKETETQLMQESFFFAAFQLYEDHWTNPMFTIASSAPWTPTQWTVMFFFNNNSFDICCWGQLSSRSGNPSHAASDGTSENIHCCKGEKKSEFISNHGWEQLCLLHLWKYVNDYCLQKWHSIPKPVAVLMMAATTVSFSARTAETNPEPDCCSGVSCFVKSTSIS